MHRLLEVDPADPRAVAALGAYLEEVLGALPTGGASLTADVDDYRPPGGCFLVLLAGEAVVGCGAVRTLSPGVGELKRMWIAPQARGRGLGAQLLAGLEARATHLGLDVLRLDTNAALSPALGLYSSRGYRAIPRYNDNPDATDFFEKRLTPASRRPPSP